MIRLEFTEGFKILLEKIKQHHFSVQEFENYLVKYSDLGYISVKNLKSLLMTFDLNKL